MPVTESVEHHFFSNSYVLVLLQWMKSAGISEEKVLQGSGLDIRQVQDIDQRVPESVFFQLLQNARSHYGHEAFGLKFGPKITLASHGVLGQALLSSQDVGHAVQVLLKYQALIFNESFIELKEDGSQIHVDLTFPFSTEIEMDAMGREVVFSCIVTSLRQMLAVPGFPVKLHLSHEKPDWSDAYYELFGPAVYFGAGVNRLSIDRADLKQPLIFANRAMAEIFEQQCEILLTRRLDQQPFSQKVKQVLLARPGYWPNIQETAERLFTSVRTLRRNLSSEQSSYQMLLDELRCELADEYLRQNQHSVAEIATVLGFSDLSNFRRAYQRWTGKTPKRGGFTG